MPRPLSIANEGRNLTVPEAAAWVGGYEATPKAHRAFQRKYLRILKQRHIKPIYWGQELRIPSVLLPELMRTQAQGHALSLAASRSKASLTVVSE